jgi:hypothetical protein
VTTTQHTPDLGQVRSIVDRAIQAAVPPGDMVDRRTRPGSDYTWKVPVPRAGLQAALTVVEMAQRKAYEFALGLRGEGTAWREVADLLDVPWSDDYSRPERAYEMVRGPDDGGFHQRNVYWTCAGPLGCGRYITDRGPYNGQPIDNEDGHDDECRRLAADMAAWQRWSEEQERRWRVMDEALPKVTDAFGRETVERARYVESHGGRYRAWSTSETLAVALALRDDETLKAQGYAKRRNALARIVSGMSSPPSNPTRWLAHVRAAATGLTS